jgi:hypothetical protein
MALLHFAFGGLAREEKIADQVTQTCNLILGPRKLRGGECPEFLPVLNNPGAKWGVPQSAKVLPNGGVTFTEYVPAQPVGLLPCDTWMLCFTGLPLNKLASWPCQAHYGQLAIAFSKEFKNRNGIRNVQYYELDRLAKDPKVIAYNEAAGTEKVQEFADELLTYRKPRLLWPEFRELYGMLKISSGSDGTICELITYDRYPDGYDFSVEAEARTLVDKADPYISFNEDDVIKILVPTSEAKEAISKFLRTNWSKIPEVALFPTTKR